MAGAARARATFVEQQQQQGGVEAAKVATLQLQLGAEKAARKAEAMRLRAQVTRPVHPHTHMACSFLMWHALS